MNLPSLSTRVVGFHRPLSLAFALLSAATLGAAEARSGYVVHEWGTFTDIQGADGVQKEWTPLVTPDLPSFVYDRYTLPGQKKIAGILIGGKAALITRQRMETPVLYFYSERERTVDVSVQFPKGTVTEWYPLRAAGGNPILPIADPSKPALRWSELKILPGAATSGLPQDNIASHYYAARGTDSSLLQVRDGEKVETEKFLFYRGVASLQAPLTATIESGFVVVRNTGSEPLGHLILCEVTAHGCAWLQVGALRPGETGKLSLVKPTGTSMSDLSDAFRSALVAEGLYEKEAAAMVKTWEDSWFQERGLRVFYTLPRAWTDRTLPLAINPAPDRIERVMVARAELITPAAENALGQQVERYVAAAPKARAAIVAETRALGLGRFLEPTMRRLMTPARTKDFNACAWELLNATRQPEPQQAEARPPSGAGVALTSAPRR